MTIDEIMIAHGEVVPTNGGEYVRERRRLAGLPVTITAMASPVRATWPRGSEPRGFDRTMGVERSLVLS